MNFERELKNLIILYPFLLENLNEQVVDELLKDMDFISELQDTEEYIPFLEYKETK